MKTSEKTDKKPERGWIEGRKDHLQHAGRGAENSDRADRAAWPTQRRSSAYAHLVNLPDAVRAGDRLEARTILLRIQATIDQGGWTAAEAARLRAMEKAWSRRQAGVDPIFNVRGWQRKGSGHNLPAALRLMRDIHTTMGGMGNGK